MGEFGNKFRNARESKDLSLDDVSNVTKISARMLQAIEQEQFDQLPGGVFNKGFIRAYAKHLGLNGEDAVTDYLACLRQAQIDAHEVWEPERPTPPRPTLVQRPTTIPSKPVAKTAVPVPVAVHKEELPELQLPRAEHVQAREKDYLGKPSAGVPLRLIAVATVVVILATFLWMRRSHTPAVAAKSPVPAAVGSSAPAAIAPTSSTPPAAAPANAASTSVHSSTPEVVPPPPKPSATTPPPASASVVPAGTAEEKVVEKGDVTIRSFGQPVLQPSIKPTASLSLVIRAAENSWISVTSDGELMTQETLIAPAATSFHATRELVVRVGNAAGVSFLWNGEELPPQGAEAEAKTFVFDAHGMRAEADPTAH